MGWWRYLLYKLSRNRYLSKVSETSLGLLGPHKQEQFEYRLTVMNKECLSKGNCVICGCQTPQLQMTNESCDGNCYPPMMEYEQWEEYKKENHIII